MEQGQSRQATGPHPSAEQVARQETPILLADAEGTIPAFPPRRLDSEGRLIPISAEERQARIRAALRALAALDQLPDHDPPGTDEELMRAINARRAPGRMMFEENG